MSDPAVNLDHLFDLMGVVCDEEASQDEVTELETLAITDRRTSRRYLGYCRMHCTLRLELRAQRATQKVHHRIGFELVAPMLSEVDAASMVAPVSPALTSRAGFLHTPLTHLSSGWPLAYLIATVIFAFGGILGTFTYVSHPTQVAWESRPVANDLVAAVPTIHRVGWITGMVNCKWAGTDRVSRDVELGSTYKLASGLVEITYDTGAKVILQGPVTYEVNSNNSGYLSLGKLTARVEKRDEGRGAGDGVPVASEEQNTSTIHHPPSTISPLSLATSHRSLFSIKTPTAIVTDLGTEFGVEVSKDGETASHVFRGSIRLELSALDGTVSSPAMILHENESARVEKDAGQGMIVRQIPINPQMFARKLVEPPRVIDLLDIVAGGNGLGHLRDRGIDPSTGMEEPVFVPGRRDVDRSYHRVTTYRYNLIDGVFSTDGGQGEVQLDSAGHSFIGFPKADGTSWGSIWARAATVPARLERAKEDHQFIYCIDGSERFTPGGRGLLCLAPKMGITFDVAAMRKAYPAVRPIQFRAVAGVGNVSAADMPDEGRGDLWVFVDGQLKLKRMQVGPRDSVVQVDIEIGPDDRFLTLVNTDSANESGCGYVIFGDPVLELVPMEEGGL